MRRVLLSAVVALVALAAQAMTYDEARKGALFLADKMAYELGLNEAQYEAVYEINFDYLMSVKSSKDLKGTYLNRRNYDINFVLTPMQYSKFYKADYFYTPATWNNGVVLKVYTRYPDRSKMFNARPRAYRFYRGEHGKKYNNVSWYKGKDFKSGRPVTGGRPNTGVGHGIRHGNVNNGIGHGTRPNHNNSGTGHGIRSGHNNSGTGAKTSKPATGIGHGVSIGTGAKPETGVGHGVSVGTGAKPETGVGHGVSIGTGAEPETGVGHGVSIGTGAGTGNHSSGVFRGKHK